MFQLSGFCCKARRKQKPQSLPTLVIGAPYYNGVMFADIYSNSKGPYIQSLACCVSYGYLQQDCTTPEVINFWIPVV